MTRKQRPSATYFLIIINIIVYLLMTVAGGSENTNVLVFFGAKVNQLIGQGEWWRLFTPMFIHIGLQHIVLNMVTLYFIGIQIEAVFGKWRFVILYLISGLGGNIASFVFSPSISAGASTSIFGLFGAFLMLGESYRQNPYIRATAKQFLILVILNLGLGFTGIDIAGHIGGLLAGFLTAYVLGTPNLEKIPTNKKILAGAALVIIYGILAVAGFKQY
ncbi:membrane-associated serine protease [Ligilactobacillus acidipiscis DSM 15836]|uniref:GlpG protein (Membrane protein of glp regulon) n=2 Tax=Ligilactobacillus acidipiscis TaxID=89059 RepID=A0A0R2K7V8_9LACO|nr:rhomboid family intramembrane serine protease [Ligilactobacillus acidipiscis]KRM32225.1 membrane-associated serine protease [Ligilactobacillus acidipiscis DSM 15836]KRN85618.1 membrane-associated serine protease [Ligilactobacillus acidipiscis]SFV40431.1 GlpG protein (membrane protein of glp regulon) [Ligilactobacillus acidipiscis]GAW64609.1 membrane-associated serine protease [Ligilactobacillus acidipiscis]GEN19434.1 rhomboid family intramembrane serine protease [Ligilactobacillus acidipisc